MKGFPTLLILTALLAMAGCGKENESGRSNNGQGICTSYLNGVCNAYSSNYNAGYSGDVNLNTIVSQIPCEMSQYGYNVTRTQQTVQVTTASRTTPGQSYLGVTSLGDIAIIVGNGSTTTQMTMFLCSGAGNFAGGVGGVTQALLGEYTTMACPIKTITAANYGYSSFRSPVYGRGTTGQKFSFCQ